MKCPKCEFENREGVKFCEECGAKLELICPGCGSKIPLDRKFCGECGHDLKKLRGASHTDDPAARSHTPKSSADAVSAISREMEGERKQVTALFSDISGYTAISGNLDPEEIKAITSRIFGGISGIVGRYDGFIEKFIGDAVMALFGAPKALKMTRLGRFGLQTKSMIW